MQAMAYQCRTGVEEFSNKLGWKMLENIPSYGTTTHVAFLPEFETCYQDLRCLLLDIEDRTWRITKSEKDKYHQTIQEIHLSFRGWYWARFPQACLLCGETEEFMILPVGAGSFREALQIGAEVVLGSLSNLHQLQHQWSDWTTNAYWILLLRTQRDRYFKHPLYKLSIFRDPLKPCCLPQVYHHLKKVIQDVSDCLGIIHLIVTCRMLPQKKTPQKLEKFPSKPFKTFVLSISSEALGKDASKILEMSSRIRIYSKNFPEFQVHDGQVGLSALPGEIWPGCHQRGGWRRLRPKRHGKRWSAAGVAEWVNEGDACVNVSWCLLDATSLIHM